MRLIFVVSPGRCGTRYLAAVMDTVPGVTAQHEPLPYFQDVMRPLMGNRHALREWWKNEKLPAIYRIGCPTYVCTSHVFCEGFVEPLLDLGVEFELIILMRKEREVALSLWRNGYIPARTETGRTFMLQPDDPGILCPYPDWASLTDYGLCYWYAREILARQFHYGDLLPSYPLTLSELMSQSGFCGFLRAIGLEQPGTDYNYVKNLAYNRTPEHLRNLWPVHDMAGQESLVDG